MAWLVAGLGNPGEAYARTRHNAGRMTLDVLAQAHRARLKKARFLPADAAEIHIGSDPVWLVTSTRFMNESGESLSSMFRTRGRTNAGTHGGLAEAQTFASAIRS